MDKICKNSRTLLFILLCLLSTLPMGCSWFKTREIRTTEVVVDQMYRPDPGAVEYVWEPPIIDVVDVPPGLDPEGHYYRPAHQEIVEIRQGRWKYYKTPQQQ